jgi:hypothetical protein
MNQATNRIQFIFIDSETRKDFDINRYNYEVYNTSVHQWIKFNGAGFASMSVYRLVIEPEKWYYWENKASINAVYLGEEILADYTDELESYTTLRPAKESEIPRTEDDNTNYELVFDPVAGHNNPQPDRANDYRNYHGCVAWLFNPYTGDGRDPRDIGSDIQGHLCVPDIPKPEKTLEEEIQEKWPDKEVVMFEWEDATQFYREKLMIKDNGHLRRHTDAQSMRGFAGYIYKDGCDFMRRSVPIWPVDYKQPIAALFEGNK